MWGILCGYYTEPAQDTHGPSLLWRQSANKYQKSVWYNAARFASHYHPNSRPSIAQIKSMVEISVVWQGNPITCIKGFGKHCCSLCMRERIEILKLARANPGALINGCSEIYGACRHRTRFHKYSIMNTSTDDGVNPGRVRRAPVIQMARTVSSTTELRLVDV